VGDGPLQRVDIATIEQPIEGYQYLPAPEADTLFNQFISTVPEAQQHVDGKTVKRVVHQGRIVGALVGVTLRDVDQDEIDDFDEGFSSGATQLGTTGEMDLNGVKAYTASGPRGAVVGWQFESAFVMVSAPTLPEAQAIATAVAANVNPG
jgi:hypothetical protein